MVTNQFGDTLVFRCPYCGVFRSEKISKDHPCTCDVVDWSSGRECHYVNSRCNDMFVVTEAPPEQRAVVQAQIDKENKRLFEKDLYRERKNWND